MKKKFKLGIIGGGFMAHSIIKGLSCAYKPPINLNKILISDSNLEALKKFDGFKVKTTSLNNQVFDSCEYIMLCIKPQTFNENKNEFSNFTTKKIISIMAGITISEIKKVFKDSSVARCMPNTPISIGSGITALDLNEFELRDKEFINSIFAALGETLWIDEDKMNAVTAISGSGPAYVYKFIDGLVQAGVDLGLTQNQSLILATMTVIGGGEMALENNNKSLKELIDAVSSKGGTTVAALEVLDKNNFAQTINQAVTAARKRAEELSKR